MKPNACLIFPNGDHFFGEGYGYEGTKTAEFDLVEIEAHGAIESGKQ